MAFGLGGCGLIKDDKELEELKYQTRGAIPPEVTRSFTKGFSREQQDEAIVQRLQWTEHMRPGVEEKILKRVIVEELLPDILKGVLYGS